MADAKLSALPAGAALADADLWYSDQSGNSVSQVSTRFSTYIFGKVSGDGTITSGGALTVTKTGGVAFAASATIDTTNASNISSGILGIPRLPPPVMEEVSLGNHAGLGGL